MLKGCFRTVDGWKEATRMILGTYQFGSLESEEDSFRMMDRYYELGGRVLDTARSYNNETKHGASKSERTVGRWLKSTGLREDIVLVTKGCYPELRDMHYSRLAPECMDYDINTSLAVLDVDYVDLWFLHRDDTRIPVGEIVDAADELVRDGLTKAIGVSNWSAARIAEANVYAEKHGRMPFSVSEIQWNMGKFTTDMHRDDTMVAMSQEDYSWYLEQKFPVFAYASLARGFFSKYPVVGKEGLAPFAKVFASETNIRRCEVVKEICRELSCTPQQLCIAYITNNPVDGYAVFGSSRMEQLEDTMTAADLKINREIIERIDAVQ